MYWNPFDLVHSGQINASGGWAAILGLILGRLLVGCGAFFFSPGGGTHLQGVILPWKKKHGVNQVCVPFTRLVDGNRPM
jgi:hypothetical protein